MSTGVVGPCLCGGPAPAALLCTWPAPFYRGVSAGSVACGVVDLLPGLAPYQRMGRWLQDAFERVPDTTLHIEPDVLSVWLGAEPSAVAQATDPWVAEGAISRGERGITLRDREQLARCSCGCHEQVRS